MGMCFEFTCPTCGLTGNVSGGDDRGMIEATTTIYYETLQDATVVDQLFADPPREVAPRCEKRKSHPIKIWNRDQPCPRCGQALLIEDPDGTILAWD